MCVYIYIYMYIYIYIYIYYTYMQVNGDGVDDLVMGIPQKGPNMRGGACVVFGRCVCACAVGRSKQSR
jgi:hypothetical protein